ncbi:RDD family protein [Sediminibacillus halophilus]|uniref:Uncharacterized membrane protein YckC, RDD family n=1 Tax=Sediminibacillus halophilus TaxID=482461 RepID=A0A1G9R7H7_9BACI|nr:RDD family protein [Sediminibacillus halophilus]SDM19081.1 Uncharacterized membrane protein YckC, RDD family [Sediminibacillus halophilus]
MSYQDQNIQPVEHSTQAMLKRRYAGFWMRFWAYITDLLVVFSVNGILLSPFHFINGGQQLDVGFWTVTGILGSIVFYVYFLLMTKFFGQTLGKMLFGLRVIREDDRSLTWGDLLFREVVGRFIHRVMFFTPVLYAVVAFTNQKQGVHDLFASTRVIHTE